MFVLSSALFSRLPATGLIVIAAFWLFPISGASAAQLGMVIGIDHYLHGADYPVDGEKQVRNLKGAVNDALMLRDALESVNVEVPDRRVLLDGDATRSGVLAAWRAMVAEARPGDTLVLTYSGHGGQEEESSAPWDEEDDLDETLMLVDFDPSQPMLGRLSDDELTGLFKEASDFEIIFIADTCHAAGQNKNFGDSRLGSRSGGEPFLTSGARRPSEVVTLAKDESAPLEHVTKVLANNNEQMEIMEVELGGKPHGALSWHLARVLDPADSLWSDGALTREELADVLTKSVSEATNNTQTPSLLPRQDSESMLTLVSEEAAPNSIPQRVALVIGNGAYGGDSGWRPLRNPPNDAKAVERKLNSRRLDFDQVIHEDHLTRADMVHAVRRFRDALRPGDTAFFFYSGHGAQAEGQNFLIGTDAAAPSSVAALKEGSVPVNDVLNVLRERKTALNVVVLDACRDDPTGRATKSGHSPQGLSSSNGVANGLAGERVSTTGFAGQTLIAFATATNQTALDGRDGMSPYTAALVAELGRPGKLNDVFVRIKDRVKEATDEYQIPWTKIESSDHMYLVEPDLDMNRSFWWLGVFLAGLVLPTVGVMLWRRREPAPAGPGENTKDVNTVRSNDRPPEPLLDDGEEIATLHPRYRLVDAENPSQGFDFPMGDLKASGELTLGGGDDVDWKIALDTISWHHARFQLSDSKLWIKDLGSTNGTTVNGVQLSPLEVQQLRPDDEVAFAGHRMRVILQAEADRPLEPEPALGPSNQEEKPFGLGHSVPCCHFTRLAQPDRFTQLAESERFDLPRIAIDRSRSLVIGREAPADWVIAIDTISARHVGVFFQSDAWWILDFGSINGSWLNGEQLVPEQARRLDAPAELRLADVVLRFDCSD